MTQPPPSSYALDIVRDYKLDYKRNAHEIKDIFFWMCNANAPSFLPPLVWSFYKYSCRRGYNTHAQYEVMKKIYRQLVWEGIFVDSSVSSSV